MINQLNVYNLFSSFLRQANGFADLIFFIFIDSRRLILRMKPYVAYGTYSLTVMKVVTTFKTDRIHVFSQPSKWSEERGEFFPRGPGRTQAEDKFGAF